LSHHDTGQEVSTGTYVRCDPFVHFDATFVSTVSLECSPTS
jgi:hypothetical protein